MNINIRLPKQHRGRKSEENKIQYTRDLIKFGEALQEIQYEITGSKHIKDSDKITARGWCYQLEGFRVINKDQFDYSQKIINICRKEGYLPIDFVAQDESRDFNNVEDLAMDFKEPHDYLESYLEWVRDCHEQKDDVSFWESQEYYLQMMVEKLDVRNLFDDICEKYHIPIANAKGWSDILSRYNMCVRFKEAEEIGLKTVLLYYGDFDPAGIKIAENFKKNLRDLEKATEWNPQNLIVDHFGLTFEFIEENHLLWIDNLMSGGKKDLSNPKHPDHNKDYVQDYLKKYGVRKCEANAILPIRNIAIKNCEDNIKKYLGENCFETYDKEINNKQKEVLDIMEDVDFINQINDLIKIVKEHKEKK